MQTLSNDPFLEAKYATCLNTTVNDAALAEIGRIVVHFGLLVNKIREFVTYFASQCDRFPVSISSEDAIRQFPDVLELIKPAFKAGERDQLTRALEQFTTARAFQERLSYSDWGISPHPKSNLMCATRIERRKYQGCNSWVDRQVYTVEELRIVAMETSLGINYVGGVQGLLKRKLAEEPRALRKKRDRKHRE